MAPAPRLPVGIDAVVAAALEEAEWLGVSRGALSRAGWPLAGDEPEKLAASMHPHLPRQWSTSCSKPT